MAVVLDAVVPIGVAVSDPGCSRAFEDILTRGRCYMTIASVEEFACAVREYCGEQLAEKWIAWLLSVDGIEIVESRYRQYMSEHFVTFVAEAYAGTRITVPAASAAALASHLKVPLATNRPSFADLERDGFCEILWVRGS